MVFQFCWGGKLDMHGVGLFFVPQLDQITQILALSQPGRA